MKSSALTGSLTQPLHHPILSKQSEVRQCGDHKKRSLPNLSINPERSNTFSIPSVRANNISTPPAEHHSRRCRYGDICCLRFIAYSLWESRKLDITAMSVAAEYLLGEHDFSSFRGSLCQAKSPIKTIEFIQLTQDNNEILLDIKANAFLHHMVRNIVGTLLKVGRGEKSIEWVKEVLEAKDRKRAGATAEPQGLYFVKAFYENL